MSSSSINYDMTMDFDETFSLPPNDKSMSPDELLSLLESSPNQPLLEYLQSGSNNFITSPSYADQVNDPCWTEVLYQCELLELNHRIESTRNEFAKLKEKLMKWQRNQQRFAYFGKCEDNDLDALQYEFEILFGKIQGYLEDIKRFGTSAIPNYQFSASRTSVISDIKKKLIDLLIEVIKKSIVIQEEPNQILRKDSGNITATIRILIGKKLYELTEKLEFKAAIINADQANTPDPTEFTSGSISNNTGTENDVEASRKLSIKFSKMQLNSIIRNTNKKNDDCVACEKFCLLFSSKLRLENDEFKVWVLSLPVTVTVHVSQEPSALVTILWDNAFAEQCRRLFEVPNKVSWSELKNVLNMVFQRFTETPLSDKDSDYLAEKVFSGVNSNDYNAMLVGWSQFAKTMPASKFSTWEWFYSIAKLIQDHLKQLWRARRIKGFVSKKEAQNLLSNRRSGTFLLRFSDSVSGGIVIAFVKGSDKQNEVLFFGPLRAKDLQTRSLADIINDTHELQYLYPDIPKTEAFANSDVSQVERPQSSANRNGYVKPVRTVILPPESSSQSSNNSILMISPTNNTGSYDQMSTEQSWTTESSDVPINSMEQQSTIYEPDASLMNLEYSFQSYFSKRKL